MCFVFNVLIFFFLCVFLFLFMCMCMCANTSKVNSDALNFVDHELDLCTLWQTGIRGYPPLFVHHVYGPWLSPTFVVQSGYGLLPQQGRSLFYTLTDSTSTHHSWVSATFSTSRKSRWLIQSSLRNFVLFKSCKQQASLEKICCCAWRGQGGWE